MKFQGYKKGKVTKIKTKHQIPSLRIKNVKLLLNFPIFILINKFSIAFLAKNFFRPLGCIGGNYRFLALSASPLIEHPRISHIHPLFMSLVGMFGGDGEMVFYVESEFLFDDLERSFCQDALNHSCEEVIDIFLCQIIAHLSLIIFSYREWLHN